MSVCLFQTLSKSFSDFEYVYHDQRESSSERFFFILLSFQLVQMSVCASRAKTNKFKKPLENKKSRTHSQEKSEDIFHFARNVQLSNLARRRSTFGMERRSKMEETTRVDVEDCELLPKVEKYDAGLVGQEALPNAGPEAEASIVRGRGKGRDKGRGRGRRDGMVEGASGATARRPTGASRVLASCRRAG